MMNIGSTSSSMMQQIMQQQMQQRQQNADTDGSGGLNIDEFTSLLGQSSEISGQPTRTEDVSELFATIDIDENGELSEEELTSFRQDRIAEQMESRGGRHGGGMMSSGMHDILLQLQEESSETSDEDLFSDVDEAA